MFVWVTQEALLCLSHTLPPADIAHFLLSSRVRPLSLRPLTQTHVRWIIRFPGVFMSPRRSRRASTFVSPQCKSVSVCFIHTRPSCPLPLLLSSSPVLCPGPGVLTHGLCLFLCSVLSDWLSVLMLLLTHFVAKQKLKALPFLVLVTWFWKAEKDVRLLCFSNILIHCALTFAVRAPHALVFCFKMC